jgi:peptide/nickel transport system substrate-binding protein
LKKLAPVIAVLVLAAVAAIGLASCGSSSSSEGKEGGTLKGAYASFPDYLDPALSYTAEGWTAMYDTYLPLLTYKHASGTEGSEVVPALAKEVPTTKNGGITNGGKTYTLFLRKGLKYSNGKPIKASDFPYSVERMFKLNSPGSPFYTTIVGAEKFAETKSGGISGIKANDKTGEIKIELEKPRGTFVNELALLFVAVLPKGTPERNLTDTPPPASGPYAITKSERGRAWSYARNPFWAKTNAKLIPEVPSGHVDKIDITVIRNNSTEVNEIERGKIDWMQNPPPPDLYSKVKEKYEGTQLRVEDTVSTYYFWMNMQKPPFNDPKVREAVNYALNSEAFERIYSGQLKGLHQILPPGMPGHKPFNLYPYNMAKAKQLIKEANPSDRNITVWADDEPENAEATQYYQHVLTELGFNAKLKEISADTYTQLIGNTSTPDLDTGWYDWFEDYPHPNDYFQPLLAGESILPNGNTNFSMADVPALNAKIAKLGEEQLGPKQEAEYAALDKEFMEEAPMAPYGTRTITTFVSSAIDLEGVIFNPTFDQDLTSFQFK